MARHAPGPYVQQFIVDGVWLGEAPRSSELLHDQLGPPSSLAFACPHCAEIWGRFPVSLPGGQSHWFQFISRTCRKCLVDASRGQGVRGSLLTGYLTEFEAAFPEAVWKRELAVHLALYPES